RVPAFGPHVVGEGVEAGGVGGDEVAVEQRGLAARQRLRVALEYVLDDALDRGQVAADLQLEVVRGDLRRAAAHHLQLVLRVGEALQPALAQRVEGSDAAAAFRRV